jgi:hypothetical protein
MFKNAAALVTPGAFSQGSMSDSSEKETATKRLFMLFHGYYGNLFLSKYATGELDLDGKDRGIKSARQVWQSGLAKFDVATVVAAAERCKQAHKEFPPSLPQFVDLCAAIQPRKDMTKGDARIGMSTELKSSYSKRARSEAMARYRDRVATQAGVVSVPDGLAGLKELIAKAVALGGGDEVATLLRLDREMAAA